MSTVKTGDIYPITLTVNTDLTGATVRVLARKWYTDVTVILPATVTDAAAGVIVHQLDGALEVGDWRVEVEVTRGGEVVTFPTAQGSGAQYATLHVVPDLEH